MVITGAKRSILQFLKVHSSQLSVILLRGNFSGRPGKFEEPILHLEVLIFSVLWLLVTSSDSLQPASDGLHPSSFLLLVVLRCFGVLPVLLSSSTNSRPSLGRDGPVPSTGVSEVLTQKNIGRPTPGVPGPDPEQGTYRPVDH